MIDLLQLKNKKLITYDKELLNITGYNERGLNLENYQGSTFNIWDLKDEMIGYYDPTLNKYYNFDGESITI